MTTPIPFRSLSSNEHDPEDGDNPHIGQEEAPFGTLLGVTDGGVQVYSCNYETLPKNAFEDMNSFQHYVDGVYTGFKWQCVELARRYLLVNHGVVFDSIPMAYDIFRLPNVRRVEDNHLLKMVSIENGTSNIKPMKGSLLIWKAQGFFKRTGHVAVIIRVVDQEYVDIAEQNVQDCIWTKNKPYSRRLKMTIDPNTGNVKLHTSYKDSELLGWTTILYDQEFIYEEQQNIKNTFQSELIQHQFEIKDPTSVNKQKWLDLSKKTHQEFAKNHGENLIPTKTCSELLRYYTLTETGEKNLALASEELHTLFCDATDFVLHHQAQIGQHFHIPDQLWPKIRKSWFQRRHDLISARFDFALTPQGLKVYEYNADSASCLFECGFIQDAWSNAVGIGKIGCKAKTGGELFEKLVDTWKKKQVEGMVHLMCDDDVEEKYHTLYMQEAVEAAGIQTKMIVGVTTLKWSDEGDILDAEGEIIRNVWKTWSWRTALNQLKEEQLLHYTTSEDVFEVEKQKIGAREGKPDLVDVLLHLNIRIFEPLWTIIPASKAILPILCQLKPKHPYLLHSSFELTPELQASGYSAKPVTGRAGANVRLFAPDGKIIEETKGRWAEDQDIYQELCMLPKYGEYNVQICPWVVNGKYGGSVLRVDKKKVIDYDSAVDPLRIISDEEHKTLKQKHKTHKTQNNNSNIHN